MPPGTNPMRAAIRNNLLATFAEDHGQISTSEAGRLLQAKVGRVLASISISAARPRPSYDKLTAARRLHAQNLASVLHRVESLQWRSAGLRRSYSFFRAVDIGGAHT